MSSHHGMSEWAKTQRARDRASAMSGPDDTLILAHLSQISGLQKHERIQLCCFNSPSLWRFVRRRRQPLPSLVSHWTWLYIWVCLCVRDGGLRAVLGHNDTKVTQFTALLGSQSQLSLDTWLQGSMVFLWHLRTSPWGRFPVGRPQSKSEPFCSDSKYGFQQPLTLKRKQHTK